MDDWDLAHEELAALNESHSHPFCLFQQEDLSQWNSLHSNGTVQVSCSNHTYTNQSVQYGLEGKRWLLVLPLDLGTLLPSLGVLGR